MSDYHDYLFRHPHDGDPREITSLEWYQHQPRLLSVLVGVTESRATVEQWLGRL